jgi:hypothetical protein
MGVSKTHIWQIPLKRMLSKPFSNNCIVDPGFDTPPLTSFICPQNLLIDFRYTPQNDKFSPIIKTPAHNDLQQTAAEMPPKVSLECIYS